MESEDKKNWALFLKGLSISSPLLTTVIAFAAFFAILSFTIQMFLKPLEQTQIEIKEDIKRLEKNQNNLETKIDGLKDLIITLHQKK